MRRWEELPGAVRDVVRAEHGDVVRAEPVVVGTADLLAVLDFADGGRVFCKGVDLAGGERAAFMLRNEVRLAPALAGIAAGPRWRVEGHGWLLAAFEYLPGRHADLRPGSADLPVVAATLTSLATALTPSPVPVRSLARRWAGWEAADPRLLAGETLAHTDPVAENLLVEGDRCRLVDWAWPATGPTGIDTAFLVVRLIQAGHTPEQAEAWAATVPAYADAPDEAVTAMAATVADLWSRQFRGWSPPGRLRAVRRWLGYRSA